MDTKQVILELRTQKGMSQDELAEKVFVSRQAVSRWENGETVPNTETLKLLSKVFDVSINTLLGSPRKLVCQCCGMPLEDDDIIGHNHDGSFNEDYCKWCYADGTYTYNDMDDLIEVCVKNMVSENFTEEQARSYMKELLPTLDYWKKYDELSDNGQFEEFKKKLINEINELNVDGMPKVEKLNALVGKYVNLEYPAIVVKVLGALANRKINIKLIDHGSDKINMSIGVDGEDYASAVQAIYAEFTRK